MLGGHRCGATNASVASWTN